MAEILGLDTGVALPEFAFNTSFGSMITILLAVLVICIAASIGIWMWFQSKIYNKVCIDFENISGQGYQVIKKQKARLIKVGDGGEEILFLQKTKQYRTAYGKKMGPQEYWFAKGQDGYFYNIVLGDLDAKMGMLDIEPIDRDMRYMHVAIRKNIVERYRKVSFMDKYGSWIMGGLVLLVFFVGMWFILREFGNLINQASSLVQSNQAIVEPLKNIVSNIDSFCSGGSGIK